MQRRDFLTLLGGAAAWPLSARAQQDGRMRRVGMLMGGSESDPLWQANVATFQTALTRLGWIEGRNLRVDIRFGEIDVNRLQKHAAELVKLAPEVILAATGAATNAVRRETQTIPIIVSAAGDDHLTRLAKNIARPEGNITGFPILYGSMGGKWLELLKEAAPSVARVAVVFNPDTGGGVNSDYRASIEAAASVFGIKAYNAPFRNDAELERAIVAFGTDPKGGLIVLPSATTATRVNRQSILLMAARYRLPAIHWDKNYPAEGGLISYGSDVIDLHRRAASYVDRILRGARIADLPVQYPTKFELVVNLKAAKAIGLTIPETFLVRADEVIE